MNHSLGSRNCLFVIIFEILVLVCVINGDVHAGKKTRKEAGIDICKVEIPKNLESLSNPELVNYIRRIRSMPFNRIQQGDDIAQAVLKRGSVIVTCLINNITSNVNMCGDVENVYGVDNRVGDIALYLIMDIMHLEFNQFLPKMRKDNDHLIVVDYLAFVKNSNNREKVKQSLLKVFPEFNKKCE